MFGKLVGLRLLAVNYQILLNNFLHISKTYGTSIPHLPALLVPPFELEPLFFSFSFCGETKFGST